MIVIVAAILGIIVGSLAARKRGGNKLDLAQYAAGYALAFVIIGMITTVVIDRILSS